MGPASPAATPIGGLDLPDQRARLTGQVLENRSIAPIEAFRRPEPCSRTDPARGEFSGHGTHLRAGCQRAGSRPTRQDALYRKTGGRPIESLNLRSNELEACEIATEIVGRRADGITSDEVAILYCSNALSRRVEKALMRVRIPYTLVGNDSSISARRSRIRLPCSGWLAARLTTAGRTRRSGASPIRRRAASVQRFSASWSRKPNATRCYCRSSRRRRKPGPRDWRSPMPVAT